MVSIFDHPMYFERPRASPFDLHFYPEDAYDYHPMFRDAYFIPRSRSRCSAHPFLRTHRSPYGFVSHHQEEDEEEEELARLMHSLRRPRTAPARRAASQQRKGIEVDEKQPAISQPEKELSAKKSVKEEGAAEKLVTEEEKAGSVSSPSSSASSASEEDCAMSSESDAPMEDETEMKTEEEQKTEEEEEERMEEEKSDENISMEDLPTSTTAADHSGSSINTSNMPQDNPEAVIKKGDTVLYRQRDNTLAPVQVVSIDHGLIPPSYVIRVNGTERETERSRLIVPAQ
mmetsp:Transcript_13672/g.32141  ORF Transcript_13672/g.32141 Transcript_13672/m.32141 type:complete len:287 (-) Transcript_13672:209-1069(-)|eukprot:CAMPEP_0177712848 /NCGR_PEP_ID=MMETSP0484_2-20121128/12621_1 /TAXON_ID=354590 /ORGANISM="Rhodomonas lens, Strain RHODO" /LENGTH=286 /DNA_ID=CAMNT_0019224691 /DNA_START=63 /DNA_END=923 /DNA_ORIENTATION=-